MRATSGGCLLARHVDSRRRRMVRFLCRRMCAALGLRTRDMHPVVANIEALAYASAFPMVAQLVRELDVRRAAIADDDTEESVRAGRQCADYVLQLVAASRWQTYRNRLAVLLAHVRSSDREATLTALVVTGDDVSNAAARFYAAGTGTHKRAVVDETALESHAVADPSAQEAGLYRCKRCGGTQTDVYLLQTRAGDEGMTEFVRCQSCGNRWRS
jgi:DNA-directed RNA polymerase subunit M/transcription elongation factor TFIIS